MRRALAIALLALVACTNDFDKFDPPNGFEPVPPDPTSGSGGSGGSLSVGSGASTSASSTGSTTSSSGDGGASQGGAGQGGVPTECVVERRCASDTQQCGEECGQDSIECQAGCPSGNPGIECKAACVMIEDACRDICVATCLLCANLDQACGNAPCETLAGI